MILSNSRGVYPFLAPAYPGRNGDRSTLPQCCRKGFLRCCDLTVELQLIDAAQYFSHLRAGLKPGFQEVPAHKQGRRWTVLDAEGAGFFDKPIFGTV
jgi:hypothetical protein